MTQQYSLVRFDPATGKPKPYPSHAAQWRDYYKIVAWLYNPWTGMRRNALSIGSDTFGELIQPPGEPIHTEHLVTVEARYKSLLQRLGVQGIESVWAG